MNLQWKRACLASVLLCALALPSWAGRTVVASNDNLTEAGQAARLGIATDQPNAILIVTPNWSAGTRQYVTAPLGVRYNDGFWQVQTLDGTALPVGSAFNVESFGSLDSAFIHTATAANTSGAVTTIDPARTTGTPPLVTALVGPNSSVNPHPVGVRWRATSRNRVEIVNLDGAPMPVGAQFNVVFHSAGLSQVSGPPIGPSSHISDIGQSDPNAFLLATPLQQGPTALANATGGVYFAGGRWFFFNQNKAPLLANSSVVLYAASSDSPALKGEPTFANAPKINKIAPKIGFIPPAIGAVIAATQKNPKFRVVITGFTCNRESWDDILERDGRRDEVFLAAQWVKLKPTNDPNRPRVLADSGLLKTVIYGDPNGPGIRLGAGTSEPGLLGGTAGGIMTGDSFPTIPHRFTGAVKEDRLPFKVWEGELENANTDERIVILPTIWEWDGPAELLAGFGRFINDFPFIGLAPKVAQLFFDTASTGFQEGGASTDELREQVVFPIKAPWAIGRTVKVDDNFFGDPHDRPIGTSTDFTPYGIGLTAPTATWLARTDFGRGAGVVPIRYRDSERLKGDYTIYVKVEKLN